MTSGSTFSPDDHSPTCAQARWHRLRKAARAALRQEEEQRPDERGHPGACGCPSTGAYTGRNRELAEVLAPWPGRISARYGSNYGSPTVHAANSEVTRCGMTLSGTDKEQPGCSDVSCGACLHPNKAQSARPVFTRRQGQTPKTADLPAVRDWHREHITPLLGQALGGDPVAAARALRWLAANQQGVVELAEVVAADAPRSQPGGA